MKAILLRRFGPPSGLVLEEVPPPVPEEDEALVRVVASSVNPADYYRVNPGPVVPRVFLGNGAFRPKSPWTGSDVAGVVVSVGAKVTKFHPGDEVFGVCLGSFAEFVTVPDRAMARRPPNVPFETLGVTGIAGLTALQGLRDHGRLESGQRVLVSGASGGVGTFAVQIAKVLGAEVTAECSTAKVDQARALGADRVVDYTKENFADRPERFDLVLVVNGRHPMRDYRRAMAPNGRCVMIGGRLGQVVRVFLVGKLRGRNTQPRVRAFIAKPNGADFEFLGALLAAGKLRAVIERTYPLPEVPRALAELAGHHARGKIAIAVAPPP